jgi:hypothetical protein
MEDTALETVQQTGADVLAPYIDAPPTATRPAFTQVPDWVMLCERISATAFRLWCVLRSMQFEKGPGIPPMTLDQVCWLLPGVKGKPTSRTRAREALDSLLEEGLLKDVSEEGLSKAAPRLYLAMDEPQRAMGWTGARRKFRGYRRLWRKG